MCVCVYFCFLREKAAKFYLFFLLEVKDAKSGQFKISDNAKIGKKITIAIYCNDKKTDEILSHYNVEVLNLEDSLATEYFYDTGHLNYDVVKSLLSTRASALTNAKSADVKIEVVRNNYYVFCGYLIKSRRLTDSVPRQIHKRLGLYEQHALTADACNCRECLEARTVYFNSALFGYVIYREEARVMSCIFVVLAGVAESDDDMRDGGV